MDKSRAFDYFGTGQELAAVLGVEHQAVYKWPDQLTPRIIDRVIAACVLSQRQVPPWMVKERERAAQTRRAAA